MSHESLNRLLLSFLEGREAMAVLIKPNGNVSVVKPANPEQGFTLDELYKLVECETVQMVNLLGNKTMWIDEEGKFREVHEVNEMATTMLHKAGGMPDDYIVGNALICDEGEVK